MKQLLLSLSICCLFGGISQAASVSGTVSSAATCAVVSGQKVYLIDTFMNVIVDSALTNSSGAYSINFPTGWTNPTPYAVQAYACGAGWSSAGMYTGVNATANILTCGTAKKFTGTIMLGSTPNTGAARVYLIRVKYNSPTLGDTTLTAVDSVTLTSNPNFTFTRPCAPTDTFLLKAALLPAHPAYNNWLPSYDSSLNWSTAQRFYSNAWNSSPHYLFMFSGTNTGGPGFIGGSVLAGANKTAGVGDPLPARLMLLVNTATNKAVGYTYSDAAGKFSFSNLAAGTYKLFGDAMGLYNVPLMVTVTTAKPSVNDIIFEEHYIKNTFEGRFGNVGVKSVAALAGVSVYPNPATSTVSLLGLNGIQGEKTVAIRNLVGAVVASQEFRDGQAVSLNVETLPAGTYILQLTTEAGTASFKVLR